MRTSSFFLFILVILVSTAAAVAQTDYHKTVVTRWAGPGQPGTYQEYIAQHPVQPFAWQEVERHTGAGDQTGPFLILISPPLLVSLQSKLDRYMHDLEIAGWDAILVTTSGGTPEAIRNLLFDYWTWDHIMGALLVGDLPVPWFELYEDFDNDGLPDNPYQVAFPCDLYYMDMNGGWYDGDVDGMLDTHLGDWPPEIFVGRLTASPLGDEVALIGNYFDKNHAFRSGELTLPPVGLAYIDDDWSGSGPTWGGALGMSTGMVDIIDEPDSTTAVDYLDRLDDGYYALLLCAHSSPQLHQFTEQGGTAYDNVFNWQIQEADPQAYFYNLFNCSGARYTDNGYIGGWYMFGDTYGLSALGSSKTGSMLYFEDFYSVAEAGECVGEAFRQWFVEHGQEPGSVMWAMSWFYGMTHLGDPTLFMRVGVRVDEVTVIDDGSAGSAGDGDAIADAGETICLNLNLQNYNGEVLAGVWAKASTQSAYVTWLLDSVFVGTLPLNGSAEADGFLLEIDPATPDLVTIDFTLEVHDDSSSTWGDSFEIEVRAPQVVLTGFELDEYQGNGDAIADPGEMWSLTFDLLNEGGDESGTYMVYLTSIGDQHVMPGTEVTGLDPLTPGGTGSPANGLIVTVSTSCPPDYAEPIILTITEEAIPLFEPRFLFQVGAELNWLDLVDNPEEVLVHYPLDNAYTDQWHVNSYRSSSGAYSMKFGGQAGAPYWPRSEGALELPLMRFGDNAQMHFQHWMFAEEGYDGGLLEINTGDGWEALTPAGGYPGSSVPNGAYPGGPCFNGEIDWQEVVVDLAPYAPQARIRFHFGADGGVQEEGWYVDDFMLTGDLISGADQDPAASLPGRFALDQNYPNPFNATTLATFELRAASRVTLAVYDVAGREIVRLVDGWRQAGRHGVVFDAEDLPSGMYIMRLTAGDNTAARKMVLLK